MMTNSWDFPQPRRFTDVTDEQRADQNGPIILSCPEEAVRDAAEMSIQGSKITYVVIGIGVALTVERKFPEE